MDEIRFHGRGGQGVVLASRILAAAAFDAGLHVQAFPSFGAERGGAPLVAFLRMDTREIVLRTRIARPTLVAVLDASLFGVTEVLEGLRPGGRIVVNSAEPPGEIAARCGITLVDASAIAVKYGLGTRTAPIVNTAILGAVVRALGRPDIERTCDAVERLAPIRRKENALAAREAYERAEIIREPEGQGGEETTFHDGAQVQAGD